MSEITRRRLLGSVGGVAFARAAIGLNVSFAPAVATPTITGVVLSNSTFIGGSGSGTVVGAITVTMTGGSFTGSLSLSGVDAASFQIVGSNLETNGIVPAGPYMITITATQAGAAGSPFAQPFMITGTALGTFTITFANTSASASPVTTPITTGQAFVRGQVPSGSIAVPQIGGSDLSYQTDNRVFWDDGSLRFARYSMLFPSIAGSSTQQTIFSIRTGTWPNTSSNTLADITGNSDFRVALANVHTAQVGAPATNGAAPSAVVSLQIAGGAIASGTVLYPSTLTIGTTNVSNGGGTGGQISVSHGVVTVVTPGAGYVNVGTGSFNLGFNDLVTLFGTNGNHNGVSVEQYCKGPIVDAWRVRGPISGMVHYHCTFYVERWKDSTGAFLAFFAYAMPGNGLVQTTTTLPNYTYDLDWKNGSTIIRGTTNGSPGFSDILHFAGSSYGTFDPTGRGDWSVNDAAYKAIIQQRTPTECDQLRSSGVILPWDQTTVPTKAPPTTPAAYEIGLNGGEAFLCVYQPLGSVGIRCALGAAGSGNMEGQISEVNTLHWMCLRQGLTTQAQTWLLNSRIGGVNSLGSSQLGGGFYDPTTFFVPNVVPVSAQPFTGMTPTLENHWMNDIPLSGYANTVIDQKGAVFQAAGNPYHQVCLTYYPYVIEAQQWGLDALCNASCTPLYALSYASHRPAVLGSTTYYGVNCNWLVSVRVPTWLMRTQGYAASVMPTTWADGASNVEQAYIAYCLQNQLTYLNNLISFIGTVKFGSTPFTKTTDFTGSGCWPENFAPTQTDSCECAIPFMDDYVAMVGAPLNYIWQGTSIGALWQSWLDYYLGHYYIPLWAYSGSHYLNDSFRINMLEGPPPALPTDPTWSSMGDVSSPQLAAWMNNGPGGNLQATFVPGSDVMVSFIPIVFQGSTNIIAGSRIKLTTTFLSSTAPSNHPLPGPFNGSTWYYWNPLSANTGQLCTDAALTMPVTCTTSPNFAFTGDTTTGSNQITNILPASLGVSLFSGEQVAGPGIPALATIVSYNGTTHVMTISAPATATATGVNLNFYFGISFWVVPANTLPADNSGKGTYNGGLQIGGSSRIAIKLGTMRLLSACTVGTWPTDPALAAANCATIFNAIPGQTGFASGPQYNWSAVPVG